MFQITRDRLTTVINSRWIQVTRSRNNMWFLLRMSFVDYNESTCVKLRVSTVCQTGFRVIMQYCYVIPFVRYLMPASNKDVIHPYGKWLTLSLAVRKVHSPTSIQSDLRPISLTATISKRLEAVAGGWILEHVRDQLYRHQYGSLKGRSTTHAVTDVVHHWSEALDNGKSVRTHCSRITPRLLIMLTMVQCWRNCITTASQLSYKLACFVSPRWVTSCQAGQRCMEEYHRVHGSGHLSSSY